ncbi:MAG TPA: universal stress protein [Lapillicoccus sp.]|nr:universal stress protein [Lapillicoccus sp.]
MSIVVGYIPTREGRAALRRAAAEAELRKADLIVVNSDTGRNFDADETLRFETALEGLRGRLNQAGVNVEVRHLEQSKEPADDLLDAAESSHAQLVVIGLRRRTPVGKLILGSNAQRILLDATCPVLAVKATGQDD